MRDFRVSLGAAAASLTAAPLRAPVYYGYWPLIETPVKAV